MPSEVKVEKFSDLNIEEILKGKHVKHNEAIHLETKGPQIVNAGDSKHWMSTTCCLSTAI